MIPLNSQLFPHLLHHVVNQADDYRNILSKYYSLLFLTLLFSDRVNVLFQQSHVHGNERGGESWEQHCYEHLIGHV